MKCVAIVNGRPDIRQGCGYTEEGWRAARVQPCPQCGTGRLWRATIEQIRE